MPPPPPIANKLAHQQETQAMRTNRLLAIALATLLIPAASLLAQGAKVTTSLVQGQTANRTNIGLISADLIANAAHDREQDATILRMTQVIAEIRDNQAHQGAIDSATATADPEAIEAAVKAAIAKHAPSHVATSTGGGYYQVLVDPVNAARWILGKGAMSDAEFTSLVYKLVSTDIEGNPATSDTVRLVAGTKHFQLLPKGVEKLISRLVGHAIQLQRTELEALEGRVDGIDDRVTELGGLVDDFGGRIEALEAADNGSAAASANSGRIGALEGQVSGIGSQAQALHDLVHEPNVGIMSDLDRISDYLKHFQSRADQADQANRLRIKVLLAEKADIEAEIVLLGRQSSAFAQTKIQGRGDHDQMRADASDSSPRLQTAATRILAIDAEISQLQSMLALATP